jgi:hypothetical protein
MNELVILFAAAVVINMLGVGTVWWFFYPGIKNSNADTWRTLGLIAGIWPFFLLVLLSAVTGAAAHCGSREQQTTLEEYE